MGDVKGQRVLDLGCGTGFYTRLFLDDGAAHVVAVDSSEAMISGLPDDNVTAVMAEVTDAPLDERFNRILCAGLLEFVPKPEKILKSVRRHANSGCRLVCLVPPENAAGRLYRLFHRRHGFTINLFEPGALAAQAARAGWGMEETRAVFPYGMVVSFIAVNGS
jgi:ubiquinone/menaquinone biosynthesis C-methylase UbiE